MNFEELKSAGTEYMSKPASPITSDITSSIFSGLQSAYSGASTFIHSEQAQKLAAEVTAGAKHLAEGIDKDAVAKTTVRTLSFAGNMADLFAPGSSDALKNAALAEFAPLDPNKLKPQGKAAEAAHSLTQ